MRLGCMQPSRSGTIAFCSSAPGQVDHQTFKPRGLFLSILTRPRENDRGAGKTVISISTERASTDDFCC